jgi:CelD/BcsL family acetyltransferase involved in cellulose biosynthesis
MKIELESWKNTSGEILASRPVLAGFYQDVAMAFAAKGKATVATLRLDDVPICAVLELRSARRLLTLKTSFDERYAKYSPGSQLFKCLIEQAFREGFKEFDFYGMMAFSRRWAKLDRRFVDLEIEGSTLRSRSVGMVKMARNWWRSRRQNRDMA